VTEEKNAQVGNGKVEKERMDGRTDKCMVLRKARHTDPPS